VQVAYFGSSLVEVPIPQLTFRRLDFAPLLPSQVQSFHSLPALSNTMADLCSKRKLAAMTADMHQPVANIRKLAVEGRRIKVPKTSHDIDTVTFEPKDPRKSSALALMDPKHYPRNHGPQFLLLKPVVEGRPWIASLLFRGSYWAAESHIGRHEAKRKVAERELSWLYSCDLHLSSNNCRYLTEKPCPASSRGQKGNGVWELELDWTALKTQSVRYYPHF